MTTAIFARSCHSRRRPSIPVMPVGVTPDSKSSYKDVDWQRVVDPIAAKIGIVTIWLGPLVCSRCARQECIAARFYRRNSIVFPAAPGVGLIGFDEVALNPRCAAIDGDQVEDGRSVTSASGWRTGIPS
jgi:hypothetical protein